MSYNCLNICRYSDFSRSSWVVYETCMRLRRCPVSRQLTNETLAAQAIVASRVQKTYNYTSEQIEACVLANHDKLKQDDKFTSLSIKMQQKMGQLLG